MENWSGKLSGRIPFWRGFSFFFLFLFLIMRFHFDRPSPSSPSPDESPCRLDRWDCKASKNWATRTRATSFRMKVTVRLAPSRGMLVFITCAPRWLSHSLHTFLPPCTFTLNLSRTWPDAEVNLIFFFLYCRNRRLLHVSSYYYIWNQTF